MSNSTHKQSSSLIFMAKTGVIGKMTIWKLQMDGPCSLSDSEASFFFNNRVFLAQTKGRREKERERKRKGKEEDGKGRGGKGEREIGSEALAETEKIANAPAGNRTRDDSKRGWSTTEPPRQATPPASLFEILSALPPLHSIGIIQCPQLTNPLLSRSGDPSRSPLCITHGLKGVNAKMRFLAQTKGRREKERERKRKGKEEEGKEKGKLEVKLWQKRKKSQTP